MSTSTVKVRRLSSVRFSNDVKDNNNSVSALRGRTATDEDIHIINTSNVPSTPSLQTLSSVAYKNPKDRVLLERSLPPSSITQPNYEDILRRVSLVIHQHCVKCEARLAKITPETLETGMCLLDSTVS